MDYWCRLGRLGISCTASGSSDPGDGRPELQLGRRDIFFPARSASFYIHSSILTFFLYFYTLFHSCYRAQLSGEALACMRCTFSIATLSGTCSLRSAVIRFLSRELFN